MPGTPREVLVGTLVDLAAGLDRLAAELVAAQPMIARPVWRHHKAALAKLGARRRRLLAERGELDQSDVLALLGDILEWEAAFRRARDG